MTYGDDKDTAAARLRQLHQYYLEHPVTGPTEGHAASRNASAPLSLGTLDHITSSVQEVVDHTRTANPDAGPIPDRLEAVYAWARQHTAHAPEAEQQRTEAIEYRHYLEHAIRAGDWRKVIRPHRCPECRTFGLMWQADIQRALCTNTECVDRDGFSTTVSLARLAYVHVASRKSRRACAT